MAQGLVRNAIHWAYMPSLADQGSRDRPGFHQLLISSTPVCLIQILCSKSNNGKTVHGIAQILGKSHNNGQTVLADFHLVSI